MAGFRLSFFAKCVFILAVAMLLASCAPKKPPEPTPLIPREDFFTQAERMYPQLSPDGKGVAWLMETEGAWNVWTKEIGQAAESQATAASAPGVIAWYWSPAGDEILYIPAEKNAVSLSLFAVSAAGGNARPVTEVKNAIMRVISIDESHPEEILLGINDRNPQFHDVYRLNLKTGARVREVENTIKAVSWLADNDFQIRLALVPSGDGGMKLYHRADTKSAWKQVKTWGFEDAATTSPLSFTADNRQIFMVSSVGANTGELRLFDPATGKEEVLASDSTKDVAGILVHPATHKLEAVRFLGDRMEWKAQDSLTAAQLDRLRLISEGDVYLLGRDKTDETWLLSYVVDNGPVSYFSYQPVAGKFELLFTSQPKLKELALAKMQPVQFAAKDGLKLRGYLTLPFNSPGKGLPAVIVAHDGPWHRDTWGFNPLVQWLASRGYAVLQVNYRGSSGYGKAFLNAGAKEWGGKMTDDLIDAAQWLVSEGTADPARIGLMGAVYGGYATLTGLTREPDLFACGVNMFGPSSLRLWLENPPSYWLPIMPFIKRQVGDPAVDSTLLEAASPISNSVRMKKPLIMCYGLNLPEPLIKENRKLRDVLLEKGLPVEFYEIPDEAQSFSNKDNQMLFFAKVEQFLADHLGGRCEETEKVEQKH